MNFLAVIIILAASMVVTSLYLELEARWERRRKNSHPSTPS